jgi:hypothetical protein
MNMDCGEVAYNEAYLKDVINVHSFLFLQLAKIKQYDIFSMIDAYMRHSDIRRKMDEGNWSALNKGYKQLLNSIDFSTCEPDKNKTEVDSILLGWMATVYVMLQWKYRLFSSEISMKLSARELCKTYNPLHEISYENACEKLYYRYLF